MPRSLAIVCGILLGVLPVLASARVVVSEVMWMGSDLSTADEWVELTYIPTGSGASSSGGARGGMQSISGWYLTVLSGKRGEKTLFTFPPGTSIGSGQHIVVSNYSAEASRLAAEPDFVTTTMMLPNTHLLLRLYDAGGTLMDAVDDGAGKPMAGENAAESGVRRSMEKRILAGSGSVKEYWVSAETFVGFDDGAPLFGTPGHRNGTGPGEDVFPPAEATDLTASILSGTLIIRWIPSVSLDLAAQEFVLAPRIGSGRFILQPSATTWSIPVDAREGVLVRLVSIDRFGNASSGVTVVVEGQGSGGRSGTFIHPGVYITEVLANPVGRDDEEWIELGNLGTNAVSIAGWVLSAGDSPEAFIIPAAGEGRGAWPRRGSGGFVLQPGEHVSFRRAVSGLSLANGGGNLVLESGGNVLDAWHYPVAAAGVSYGRSVSGSGTFRSFCSPTEGARNTAKSPDVSIVIQSGEVSGMGKVSVNLVAETAEGLPAPAGCSWTYGDGFVSGSCNPPAHSFTEPGLYTISLSAQTLCGDAVTRTLVVEVRETEGEGKEAVQGRDAVGTCVPGASSGVVINELLPDPHGDDEEGEWVELRNTGDETVSLCGWLLDDGEGGSTPYVLGVDSLAPGQHLLLRRRRTKIVLNNAADAVRLFAGSGNLVDDVAYVEAEEGSALGRREDGTFAWTPHPTPGEPNHFQTVGEWLSSGATLSAVFPGLPEKGGAGGWIEVRNTGEEMLVLDGWLLANDREEGDELFVLRDVALPPGEVHRISLAETRFSLQRNTAGAVKLLDSKQSVVSVLSWEDGEEERVHRPPVLQGEHVPARVVRIAGSGGGLGCHPHRHRPSRPSSRCREETMDRLAEPGGS